MIGNRLPIATMSYSHPKTVLSEKRVKQQVINVSSRKANLKRRIRRHIRKIGFHKRLI